MAFFSSKSFFLLSAVVTSWSGLSNALGPIGDLTIVNRDIAPDGFKRSAVLAGGTFPGPLITATKGDTLEINVVDQLTDGRMNKTTSVHWHGFAQKGTNWADGVASVTQCPIASGHSFKYKFHAEDQAGTFWYHSHLGTQYCDGLRGPIVVYDPRDPHKSLYDVDNADTVITVADWYHVLSNEAPPGPVYLSSTLINGRGRYPGGPSAELAVVSVQQGKRYRMRLVSTSCDSNYQFSIDGHSMSVIEADGISVKPVKVDSIQIFAGQRYSFVLNANAPVGNYWIRAKPNLNDTLQGFDGGINSAILRYVGAPKVDPISVQLPSLLPLVETNLKPLSPCLPGEPGIDGADVNINLDMELQGFGFAVNGATYFPPSIPVLLQILSGAASAQDLMPKGSVIAIPRNKVIQVTLPAAMASGEMLPGAPHPIHLHGHTFSVVRSAGNSSYNFVDPPRRDVVSMGTDPSDKVTIRFTTDNPGPWILHCHIDWHLKAGFAIVFAEDMGDTASAIKPIPKAWDDLCPIYNALSPSDL